MPLAKRLVRWVLFSIAAIVLLIGLAVVVVTTPWFKDWLRGLVIRQAAAAINGTVEIGHLSGSLFRSVELRDIVIRQEGQPVIAIAGLSAQYDIVQIALGRYSVDEVHISRPVVHVIERADGYNVATLVRTRSSSDPSAPFAIAVGRVFVSDGEVTLQRIAAPIERFSELGFEASVRYATPALSVGLRRFSARVDRTGVRLGDVAGDIRVDERETAVENLVIATPASRVSGRVVYRSPLTSVAEIDVALDVARLETREFAAYLPADVSRALTASGQVSAIGPLDALEVSWQITTNAGDTTGALTAGIRDAGVAVDGTIAVTRLDLRGVTGQPTLSSDISARTTLQGVVDTADINRSDVRFTLDGSRLMALGYEIGPLRLSGTFANGRVDAAGTAGAYGAMTSVTAGATGLSGEGRLRLNASGHLRRLNLVRLPRQLSAPAFVSEISGAYTVRLVGDDWAVSMTADDSWIASASIAAGTMVTAESTAGRFSATVDGTVSGLSAELLQLPATRPTSVGGRIQARIALPRLSGPFDLARVDGNVLATLDGSTIAGVTLDAAVVDASITQGLVDIRKVDVTGQAVVVSAQGHVVLTEDGGGTSNLTFSIAAPDVTTLSSFGVTDVEGGIKVEGTIEGPSSALVAAGRVDAHQLKYGETADALTLGGTFEVKVPDRDFKRATGAIDMESTFLTVKGYEINRLALEAEYHEERIDLTTRIEQKARTIELEGGIVVHPDHQEVHVRQFALSGLGDAWRLESGRDATVHYSAAEVIVEDWSLVRAGERLDVDGRIAMNGQVSPSDLNVSFSGVSVGDLYTLMTGTSRVTGTADGKIALTGTLSSPRVAAGLRVVDGKVQDVAFTEMAADVNLEDRRATVDAHIREPLGNTITIVGEVPTSADAGPLALDIKSSAISLGLAEGFTSELRKVTGQAAIELQVAGTVAAPVITGALTIADGGFLLASTGVTYHALNADVTFDGQRAAIGRFSIADNDNRVLRMSGGGDVFTTGRARAFDIRIATDGFAVLRNELGDVDIRADAQAQGDLASPRISGSIAIARGRIEVDELLRRSTTPARAPAPVTARVGWVTRTSAPQPPAPGTPTAQADAARVAEAPSPSPWANAVVNLTIRIPDNLVLRGRDLRSGSVAMGLGDLNLTIGGNLDVRKEAGTPIGVVGSLQTVRGFYDFQGRRFDVVRGSTVSFRGPEVTNPSLDITGQREVSGVVAEVHVTGTLQRPRLLLSSQPSLEEGDILSLIIFNQPINQLGESEQVDLVDRATQLALGALATSLSTSIGNALDVDLFEIRAPSTGQAGEVTIGRQVSDRLFVGFRQEFGEADATRLSFEYRLTDALRILTSVAQGTERSKRSRDQEAAGVDLVFRVRY